MVSEGPASRRHGCGNRSRSGARRAQQMGPARFMPLRPDHRSCPRLRPRQPAAAPPRRRRLRPDPQMIAGHPTRAGRMRLPPAQPLPDVPHSTMPPAPVFGVPSIPDVWAPRSRTRRAEKSISERPQKRTKTHRKGRRKLRDMGQALAGSRQADALSRCWRAKKLRDRLPASRGTLTHRNRMIRRNRASTALAPDLSHARWRRRRLLPTAWIVLAAGRSGALRSSVTPVTTSSRRHFGPS